MKRLLLATALTLATTTTYAQLGSYEWSNNSHGLSLVQEDGQGMQFAAFETCGGELHGLTFFDGDMEYKGEGYSLKEIKIRVDKKTIHTFNDVDIGKSPAGGVKYYVLADNKLYSEMKSGNTMRVQYNGKVVETYSLIGFTRAVSTAATPEFCETPENDYFQDSSGNEYFRS